MLDKRDDFSLWQWHYVPWMQTLQDLKVVWTDSLLLLSPCAIAAALHSCRPVSTLKSSFVSASVRITV